jgi:hypothetical protein
VFTRLIMLVALCLPMADCCFDPPQYAAAQAPSPGPTLKLASNQIEILGGLVQPKVIGGYVTYGANSTFTPTKAALITVERSDYKYFDIEAELLPSYEPVNLVEIEPNSYLLVATGRVCVTAMGFEPGFKKQKLIIELGPPPPPPKPPTPPAPPVPDDAFGNLGKRVATAAAGLPKTPDVAKLYRQAADRLASDPQATINSAVDTLVADRGKLLTPTEVEQYKPLISLINTDMQSRWPMARQVMSEFLQAIALGLEATK